jgi:hypothetical protein
LVDKIFLKLGDLFEQPGTGHAIDIAAEAPSLMTMVRDERVGGKSFVLFQKIMGLVNNDDRLWEPARLCMKGAFSPIGQVPHADDLNIILELFHHHISSQRRIQFGDEPIYHSFRTIVDSFDDHSHQRFAGCFTSPLFIDTIVGTLSNVGCKELQEMAIALLPALDTHLPMS